MGVILIESMEKFEEVIKTGGNKLIVIDFYATWCGPCRMLSPRLEELSKEKPNVLFYKVDVDEVEDAAQKMNISAMPTVIFFKNGVEIKEKRQLGNAIDKIKEVVEEYS